MKSRAFVTLGITAALAACSLAPHYQRPDTASAPAEYQEARGWKLATPSDTEARGPWWTVFQDTTLDTLESQVTDANQDLKAAFARLQEARAQTRIVQAGQFPRATADASANRTRASVNSPTYDSREPAQYSDLIAGVTLSYDNRYRGAPPYGRRLADKGSWRGLEPRHGIGPVERNIQPPRSDPS